MHKIWTHLIIVLNHCNMEIENKQIRPFGYLQSSVEDEVNFQFWVQILLI